MLVRSVLARQALAVLIVVWSLFSRISTQAASISLAWNPSPTSAVVGYEVFYGLVGYDFAWSINTGSNTSVSVCGLTPGSSYCFVVVAYDASGVESPLSNEAIVTIPGGSPLLITSAPPAQTVFAGGTATFSVSAAGPGPLVYQWFNGTSAVPGATNTTLTLPNVSDANAGNYGVVVANSQGTVTSSLAALTVMDPPVITTQPASQTVLAGSAVLFSLGVAGTAPLTYQWCNGARALPSATNSTLVVSSVGAGNTGEYYAVVQNAAGTAYTSPATLAITTNPFALLAGAYNGLFYQTNGTVPDVTVQTAGMLGNCLVSTNGTYSANVYFYGSVYPLSGVLNASGKDTEVVSCAANGLPNLNVSLQLDMTGASQSITGAVSNMDTSNPWTAPLVATLATNALSVPAGDIDMVIPPQSGAVNAPLTACDFSIVSTGAGVNLWGVLADGTSVIQTAPMSQNGSFPLYASLYGGSGLLEGWVNLAGGVPSGTITWVCPTGISSLIPYPNGFTNVTTIGTALATLTPPVITAQPANQTVNAGGTAAFAVGASNGGPLTYQWYDGAAALSGATNAALTLPDVSDASAGNYSVVIANSAGSVTSSVAALSVVDPPVITVQPVAQSVFTGGFACFTVGVNGTAPVSYEWLYNGTPLASEQGLNFLLVPVSAGTAGNYSVVVANSAGSVTSSVAPLQTSVGPTLAIAKSGNDIVVSWPSSATGYTLQQNSNLATTNWTASGYPVTTNGATASITISSPTGNMFFRLISPGSED